MRVVHGVGVHEGETVHRGNDRRDGLPTPGTKVGAYLQVVGGVGSQVIDRENKRSIRDEMTTRQRARGRVVIRRKVHNGDVGDRRGVERHCVRGAFIFELRLERLHFDGTETIP